MASTQSQRILHANKEEILISALRQTHDDYRISLKILGTFVVLSAVMILQLHLMAQSPIFRTPTTCAGLSSSEMSNLCNLIESGRLDLASLTAASSSSSRYPRDPLLKAEEYIQKGAHELKNEGMKAKELVEDFVDEAKQKLLEHPPNPFMKAEEFIQKGAHVLKDEGKKAKVYVEELVGDAKQKVVDHVIPTVEHVAQAVEDTAKTARHEAEEYAARRHHAKEYEEAKAKAHARDKSKTTTNTHNNNNHNNNDYKTYNKKHRIPHS